MSPRRPLAVLLWCVSLFGWLSSPCLLRAQGAGAAQATVVSDAEIQAILDGLGNPDRNVGRAALDKVQKLDAVPALRAFLQGKIPGSATPTTAALVDISDQFLAVDALESIGTPEALAAVKEYKAKSR